MKKIVLFGLAVSVLALTGCATAPLPPAMVTQTIPVKSLALTSLDVNGPYVVQVVNAPAGTPIRVIGDPHSVNATNVSVGSSGKSVSISGSLIELIPPGPVFVIVPTQQTKTLNAEAEDQASLSLQLIPYDQVKLSLYDLARADVYVTQSLTIQAKDNSSVFYYGPPAQVTTKGSAPTAEIQQLPLSDLPQITVPTAPPMVPVSTQPTTTMSGAQSLAPATVAKAGQTSGVGGAAPGKPLPPVVTANSKQIVLPPPVLTVSSGVSPKAAASSAPASTAQSPASFTN